jgi:hypothetical protein
MLIHTIEEAISRLRYIQLDSDFPPSDIAHMILAGGPSQPIYNVQEGKFQSAVELLCSGTREIQNYPIAGGIVREDSRGPYFHPGTRLFPANKRVNELLGILTVAGIHFDGAKIVTDKGTQGTLTDMVDSAMDRYSITPEEQSWSLMVFSVHPGVTAEWRNRNGELQSVDRILRSVIQREHGIGACFGTHAIEAVSFAISRYCLERDIEPENLEGIWKDAWQHVISATNLMKRNQRDDGSINRCWYKKARYPKNAGQWQETFKDLASRRTESAKAIVYPTGHCLDAISPLAMFLTDREWIDSATYLVADTIESRWIPLAKQISTLTHAIHALKLLGN